MRETHVAGRYARALLLLIEGYARKSGEPLVPQLERALEDLRGLAAVVAPGSRVGDFLAHPQVRPDLKQAALRKGLEGRAARTVVVFADLLLRKHRLGVARDIVREFEALVERAQGVQRAQVVSAVPLTDDELARLHRELERNTGRKIVLAARVDPSIVGGAYVRIGDRIIDRSVTTLLESIAHQLYEVSV
jgi:F-type H+-transporting ATPase subunit delta